MKRRTHITLNPGLFSKAEKLMQILHYDDLSGFVEDLIREEYQRRYGPFHFNNAVAASPSKPEHIDSYRKDSQRRKRKHKP